VGAGSVQIVHLDVQVQHHLLVAGPAGQVGWRETVSVHDSATTESLPPDSRRGRIWAFGHGRNPFGL
jgi:hypothetical protein